MDFLGNAKNDKGEIIESVIEEKIQEVYYKELAIQTAITLIANAIAKCEIKVYEKNREVKNKTYYTLNVSPNKNENSSCRSNRTCWQCDVASVGRKRICRL